MPDAHRCPCRECLYGSQPHGYFPIVCCHGKRTVEMWHEKYSCRHFEPCPELEEEPAMNPWQVIKTNKEML